MNWLGEDLIFTQYPHYLCFFSIIKRSVLMALVFSYTDMLEKVAIIIIITFYLPSDFQSSLCS